MFICKKKSIGFFRPNANFLCLSAWKFVIIPGLLVICCLSASATSDGHPRRPLTGPGHPRINFSLN